MNRLTDTTLNEKRSMEFARRKWYYEKKFRDNDCKFDKHPEIRAIYYARNPKDKDLQNEKYEIRRLVKKYD